MQDGIGKIELEGEVGKWCWNNAAGIVELEGGVGKWSSEMEFGKPGSMMELEDRVGRWDQSG